MDEITSPDGSWTPPGDDSGADGGDDRGAGGRSAPDRRRRWTVALGVGGVAVALVVFVLVWFQPHKLFIDDRVDQALPTVAGAGGDGTDPAPAPDASEGADAAATTATTAPPGPVDLATGSFTGIDHPTSGTARLLELGDGSRYLRLEGFETDNGPDLYVYLSTNPAAGPEAAFDDSFVDLGRLQGNIGDQNYALPADVDTGAYASVVIWCDRFDSAFGAADLTPAAG